MRGPREGTRLATTRLLKKDRLVELQSLKKEITSVHDRWYQQRVELRALEKEAIAAHDEAYRCYQKCAASLEKLRAYIEEMQNEGKLKSY